MSSEFRFDELLDVASWAAEPHAPDWVRGSAEVVRRWLSEHPAAQNPHPDPPGAYGGVGCIGAVDALPGEGGSHLRSALIIAGTLFKFREVMETLNAGDSTVTLSDARMLGQDLSGHFLISHGRLRIDLTLIRKPELFEQNDGAAKQPSADGGHQHGA